MRAVADSSVWISLLVKAEGHDRYQPLMAPAVDLLVPAIIIYEVVRWSLGRRGEAAALAAQEFLERRGSVPIDADLAAMAAAFACRHKLAMADSIIYATARRFDAELWTQDADFEKLPGVRWFPKIS